MFTFALLLFLTARAERVVETVVPALAMGAACSSRLEVTNLSGREVVATVEAFRGNGALAAFSGQGTALTRFPPGARRVFVRIDGGDGDESAGWARVRETVPGGEPAALSLTASSECVTDNQLRTAPREGSHPARDAWFEADTADWSGSVVMVVNSSEWPAIVTSCYSSGILVSGAGTDLMPLCSVKLRDLLPAFAARQFPVAREGSSHFSLTTEGSAVVLQMLRPVEPGVKLFRVDSSVSFGGEPVKP